jgi:hypothetical protein
MYVGVFLLLSIWEAVRFRFNISERPAPAPRPAHPLLIPAAAAGLLLLFTAQLWTVAFMAHRQIAPTCWLHLPIPVVADLGEDTGGPAQPMPGFLLGLIAAAQSFLLFLMYRARESAQHPLLRIVIPCVCAVACAEAIFAPAMTSPDVYYYITYAHLGFASFSAQPQAVTLPGLPLADWCEQRVLPSAYGPAFIAYMHFLPPGSPVAQILMIRAANTLWFLALLVALAAAGAPAGVVRLAALNPILLFQYVASPHNDLIATVLVVAGVALAARRPLAASIAVIAAALFKLSFALTGMLIFTRLPTLRARVGAAAATCIASLALSYLFAGPKYFAGLAYFDKLLAPEANRLQYIAFLGALAAVAYALLRQGFSRSAVYAFPALRVQAIFPWYAIWPLPYALLADAQAQKPATSFLASFLILMPIMAFLMETGIARSVQMTAFVIVAAGIIAAILRDMRHEKDSP